MEVKAVMKGKTEDVCAATQVPPASWPRECTLTPGGTSNPMTSFSVYICFLYLEIQYQTWSPDVVSQALDSGEDSLATSCWLCPC